MILDTLSFIPLEQSAPKPEIEIVESFETSRNALLKSLGVEVQEFIEFRHQMHMIAEGGFDCFNTHALIKKKLHELGIKDS